MGALLEHPLALGAAAAAVLLALLVLRRRGAAAAAEEIPGLDALIAAGSYDDAAALALEHQRPRVAIELLLRGQRVARAAGIAAREGDLRLAGELYDRAGEFERAAQCYERAGMIGPAQESRAKAPVATPNRPAPGASAPTLSLDDAARAAEERLGAGDIEAAAGVYRDAGMLDEAVHLYANVLGLPGEAAPLVAKLGNAERAAELYEIAGMRPEAARAWAEVARALRRPEDVAQRVVRLDPAVGLALLEDLARAKPLAGEGVTLHFELAVLLADRGDLDRARGIFGDIERAHGAYRDVGDRLRALRPGGAASSRAPEAVQVVVQPVIVAPGEEIDMARIAQEAAAAAVSRARRTSVRPAAVPPTRVHVTMNAATRGTVLAPGLEETPITAVLLHDGAVREAREGPSVAALTRYIKGSDCDLGNIEVFYRLGVAHLAGGDWDRALRCFEQVEEASPGYRDAGARASEVRRWREAMGARRTLAGAEGTAGRYELRGELGRGGMAVVYRAIDAVLDREVALKFLNAESSANADLREMFQREARSVAQLNHANIVTVYDFGTYAGRAFLAMEFVEGVTVDQLVQSEGRLGVVEALRITSQVLQALEYAHARKIIHRDVKPSNMMRSTAGVVKLMDFGLAKSIAQGDKASLIAGTPAYMPPEQLYGRRVDHRADLYATAASLYEMLSGRLPFASMDRSAPPPPLRAQHPEVPEVIERLITRGLAVDPEQRMPSAGEFAASLQRVLGAVERGSLRPPAGAPSVEVIPALPPPSAALAALVPGETAAAPKPATDARNPTVRFGAPRR